MWLTIPRNIRLLFHSQFYCPQFVLMSRKQAVPDVAEYSQKHLFAVPLTILLSRSLLLCPGCKPSLMLLSIPRPMSLLLLVPLLLSLSLF